MRYEEVQVGKQYRSSGEVVTVVEKLPVAVGEAQDIGPDGVLSGPTTEDYLFRVETADGCKRAVKAHRLSHL
jgi:hypothetical protein